MSVSFIYSIIAFGYGAALFVAAFFSRHIPLPFLESDKATAIAFTISAALAIPFVITYTKLGLNTAEGEKPSAETQARHQALRRECPIWPIAWYGGIGFILVSWVIAVMVPNSVHPLFASSSVISCWTGTWFMIAYPVARRLFGP